ncbi:flagellar assembly protein FliW [bacterium]|jgi:flagellar assembly factor FliW|nr:flagellar assembly protein FliW [bacterium]
MKVRTHRFGTLDVEREDLILFPEGLVGLSRLTEFVLFQDPTSPDLFWLQSTERSEFAFATIHSSKLGTVYDFDWDALDLENLELESLGEAEVFVILNRVGGTFTANLKGPIIINSMKMIGKQVVLKDGRFDVRHPLQVVEEPACVTA